MTMIRWFRSVVIVATPVCAVLVLGPSIPSRCRRLAAPRSADSFAGLIVDLSALLAVLLSAALVGLGLLTVATALVADGSRLDAAVAAMTPTSWRAAVLALVGVSILMSSPAGADDGPSGLEPADPARYGPRLTGLLLPDRPSDAVPSGRSEPGLVVVREGDTLWAIARRSFRHPEAVDQHRVARATAHWYAANRTRIGHDPDLILPGLRLRPPADDNHSRNEGSRR